MWVEVPKEVREHESVAYKSIAGKRDMQLGFNPGSPAFILDDPGGDSWVMRSASDSRCSARDSAAHPARLE